ncbi:MAG: hypothetical protein PHX10_12105 [Gallionellaceae bacterium]|nr:hypothetical protein [Gallionellaceae bacterium]
MAKPPGTNPAKLAEHAKALQELGYQAEAAKLYEHACQWGYTPACAQIKAEGSQAARPAAPAHTTTSVAQPRPQAVAMAKPAPAPIAAASAPASPASHVAAQSATPPAAPPPPAAHVMAQPAPVAPVAAPASQPAAPAAAPIVQAAIKPMAVPAPQAKPAVVDTRKLSEQAHGLEDLGYAPVAITLYKDACHAGDGLSCKRLGEIYIKGIDGVKRDYAESVRWYDRARKLGVDVPSLEKRTVYR